MNHPRLVTLTLWFAASIGIFLLTTFLGCDSNRASVSVSGDKASIDVQTMGEYGTNIVRVVLSDSQTHAIVWEVKAKSDRPHIHAFTLHSGDNSVSILEPQGGSYEVVAPASSGVFHLARGTKYELRFWKSLDSGPQHVEFQFAN